MSNAENNEIESKGQSLQPGPKVSHSKSDINPFWLDVAFPNLEDIFKYSTPTLSEIASNCVFALDANILLEPYTLGSDSFVDIERIYKSIAVDNRLYIPAQAAREYVKNRGIKISQVYKDVSDRLSKLPDLKEINCPILEGVGDYDLAKENIEALRIATKNLKQTLNNLKSSLVNWGWNDKVSCLYRELFKNSRIIAHKMSAIDFASDVKFRSIHQMPPGYKDSGKFDGGVGDLHIWHSLLEIGRLSKAPLVFVTRDGKADWSVRSADEAIMPRPELAMEFYEKTGQKLLIINWNSFLTCLDAKPDTLKEIQSTNLLISRCNQKISDVLHELFINFQMFTLGLMQIEDDSVVLSDDMLEDLQEDLAESIRERCQLAISEIEMKHLNRLQELLIAIREDTNIIGYLIAREKSSGQDYKRQLRSKIEVFISYCDNYYACIGRR